ncbi:MAG: MFS transporter [Deltaproteobacteria bacterium]|nr:MFS transporter [Deltaproteobacteria bacterium]
MSDHNEPSTGPLPAFIGNGFSFMKRQHRDWKVTVLRTSLDKFAYQMVFPYLSLYIVALGATGTELGLVNSIGMIVAGILGPYTGWIIDRTGPKRIYLIGIVIVGLSYLLYGLAVSWQVTLVAMMAYWVGSSTSTNSCATICGNCLVNRDRATGMLLCETVTAGLLGMVAPMLATWIVSLSGGISAAGIRPLFFLGMVVTGFTFVLVLRQLSERKYVRPGGGGRPHLIRDIIAVLHGGRQLKKWLVLSSLSQLPYGMVLPFMQVYAHKFKGADELVLGAMVAASALSPILFSIPLGRMADRVGRKKVLYITIPLFCLSNLVLVAAPSPAWLVVAGILQGFFFIGLPVSAAIERELVPQEQMGRWVGMNRFVKMVLGGLLALTAGIIWDRIGPQYLFLIPVAVELLVRIPLLVTLPETLHGRSQPEMGRDSTASGS